MAVASFLTAQLDLIESTLDRLTTVPQGPYGLVFEAARYTLFSKSKRIRPLLTLATAEALGAVPEKAIEPACALEMIHTYSLIHDDLPCMDNDDLRRGKPTLHKVYPEGQALLAGDLLLTLAFETLSKSKHLTAEQIVRILAVLSFRSGGEGMIGGQSLDLASEGQEISWATLKNIHLGKTASLISASLEIGGIAAETSEPLQKLLQQLGQNIGLSFQIIDDVLDVEGSPETLGKPTFSDMANQKTTSVSLLGLKGAKALADDLLKSSLDLCKEIGIGGSFLADMLPRLVHRTF